MRYLVLGFVPSSLTMSKGKQWRRGEEREELSHDVCEIAKGDDAKAIIAAACAAPCGVMLIDMESVPNATAVSA